MYNVYAWYYVHIHNNNYYVVHVYNNEIVARKGHAIDVSKLAHSKAV